MEKVSGRLDQQALVGLLCSVLNATVSGKAQPTGIERPVRLKAIYLVTRVLLCWCAVALVRYCVTLNVHRLAKQ